MRGSPANPLDGAHQGRWPEGAAELLEPGREVCDADGCAVFIVKGRDENGGVLHIVLEARDEPFENDIEEAAGFGVGLMGVAQQRVEHGIAVEVGQAGPADAPARVDQGAEAAVADHAAVERPDLGRRHGLSPARPLHRVSSS